MPSPIVPNPGGGKEILERGGGAEALSGLFLAQRPPPWEGATSRVFLALPGGGGCNQISYFLSLLIRGGARMQRDYMLFAQIHL